MTVAVSPKFTSDKLNSGDTDDYIDVYEDRVNGWFLGHARMLISDHNPNRQHAGFAVLMLALGYFESYWIHKTGHDSNKRSEEFFVNGFLEVFPGAEPATQGTNAPILKGFLNDTAKMLYQEARCGLYHNGMTRSRISIARTQQAIQVMWDKPTGEIKGVLIDPENFLSAIEAHFIDYVARLRNPSNVELRDNFMRAWDLY